MGTLKQVGSELLWGAIEDYRLLDKHVLKPIDDTIDLIGSGAGWLADQAMPGTGEGVKRVIVVGSMLIGPGEGRAIAAAQKIARARYVSEVEALRDLANSARAAGQDAEATARMVSAERNALKVKYRELSPADAVKKFETRNLEKYGNPLGPTVDQLRAQGKTWEEIIESASRPGGADLGY